MSDYGDDEFDWDDPNVLAELESLESNAAASVGRINPPPPPPPRGAAAVVKAPQPAVPRASQLPPPPPPKPAPVPVIPAGRPPPTTANADANGSFSRGTTPLAAAPVPRPSQYGNARPGLILRPARPPQQQRVAKPAAPQQPPPLAVKQELSTSNLIPAAVNGNVEEDEDENLPEIRINEQHHDVDASSSSSSLYRAEPQRGITITRPPPPPPAPVTNHTSKPSPPPPRAQQNPVSIPSVAAAAAPAIKRPPAPDHNPAHESATNNAAILPPPPVPVPGRDSNSAAAAAAAGGSGLSAQEREELETLRREKAKVSSRLPSTAPFVPFLLAGKKRKLTLYGRWDAADERATRGGGEKGEGTRGRCPATSGRKLYHPLASLQGQSSFLSALLLFVPESFSQNVLLMREGGTWVAGRSGASADARNREAGQETPARADQGERARLPTSPEQYAHGQVVPPDRDRVVGRTRRRRFRRFETNVHAPSSVLSSTRRPEKFVPAAAAAAATTRTVCSSREPDCESARASSSSSDSPNARVDRATYRSRWWGATPSPGRTSLFQIPKLVRARPCASATFENKRRRRRRRGRTGYPHRRCWSA